MRLRFANLLDPTRWGSDSLEVLEIRVTELPGGILELRVSGRNGHSVSRYFTPAEFAEAWRLAGLEGVLAYPGILWIAPAELTLQRFIRMPRDEDLDRDWTSSLARALPPSDQGISGALPLPHEEACDDPPPEELPWHELNRRINDLLMRKVNT